MALLARARQTLLPGVFAALGAATSFAGVVQVDISSSFNADLVVNDGSGANDATQDAIDLGVIPTGNWCFPSQSVADNSAVAPQTPDGLPDDAFFPAAGFHPDVQLSWSNDDDGLNGWRLAAATGGIRMDVPAGLAREFHLFATAGDGDADIDLTPIYDDGMGAPQSLTVPDWFDDPVESAALYFLINGRDRMQPGTGPGTLFEYSDRDEGAIFGLSLALDPTRRLLSVKLDRTDTDGVLDVFGAVLITEDAPEACCFDDAACLDLGPAECAARGGFAQGPGSDCAGTDCPLPGLPGWAPDGAARAGDVLRVAKSGASDLELTWGRGCSAEALDMTVHGGLIGDWYGHEALVCDTLGAFTTATLPADPGGRYFLVVPITATLEGSYGLDSFGVERPPSDPATCRPMQVLGCP